MDRHLIVSTIFLVIIEKLGNVNGYAGYEWVPYKPGDTLPNNNALVEGSGNKYIGRARHFDEILPAEVTAEGQALISSCHKEIPKEQFELLTTLLRCEWKSFSDFGEIDETIVRAGTAWNGEPIYIGTSHDYEDNIHVLSIYLTKPETYTWHRNYSYNPQWKYLSCNNPTKWMDSSSVKIPNNTVSGGKSKDDYEMYVAQLKRGCEVVTGQVIPETGAAMAFLNDGEAIKASYCQVLIGEPNEYTWVPAADGEIPDYAVATVKDGRELAYVARFNSAIGHLTHSEALDQSLEYDILVANQL